MKVNSIIIINKLKKYMKHRKATEKSKTNKKTTKSTKSKTKELTPCPEGKVRNPDTNRCKINKSKKSNSK